ncbi:MAG TPA: sugar phosphate isomerase/epimerase family protein [Caldilineaceae bacterium]|nr:sugar phosphate isomerase/epimerase family protein [Caldilineaceae bacterium]
MRFGVNTWVWVSPLTSDELERLVLHVAALGFDWIEFPIEAPGGYDYRRAGELAQAHGLGTSVAAAMAADRDLIHPDVSIRANGVAFVEHCLDAAHTMRATNLIGPMYAAVGRTWQATPTERQHDIDLLVPQLRRLADYAGERGVTLCLEPLNRFETSFLNLASQAVELVDQVDHPACQLMLDTFHMNIEEQSLGAAIRMVGPRLKHFHACENDRGAPGSGHVPWGEVVEALRAIQYDGPVVIESFTDQVKSIAKAAAIWRPLARSQDALAQDGLAFLKTLLAE